MIELNEQQKQEELKKEQEAAKAFFDRMKAFLDQETHEIIPQLSVTADGIIPTISVRKKNPALPQTTNA